MEKMFNIMAIVWIAICVGWIMSIVKLCHCDFDKPYKAEVVYGVGTIIPVAGAVIGWLDMGK